MREIDDMINRGQKSTHPFFDLQIIMFLVRSLFLKQWNAQQLMYANASSPAIVGIGVRDKR